MLELWAVCSCYRAALGAPALVSGSRKLYRGVPYLGSATQRICTLNVPRNPELETVAGLCPDPASVRACGIQCLGPIQQPGDHPQGGVTKIACVEGKGDVTSSLPPLAQRP